jgi:nucleotide-binding universal stress UspA family protein
MVPGPAASDAATLHAAVDARQAELLVVDPDTGLRVAHEAPCAIAVAPEGSAPPTPAEPREIAVAWDASAEADEALEWAVQLAERTAGTVRIVYVFEHAGIGRVAGPDVRSRLEEVRAAAAQRAPSTAEVRTGAAVPELTRDLGDADLLVMGSRARSPLLRVVLGSVAAGVVRDAPCPVVVLPRGVHAPVETTV